MGPRIRPYRPGDERALYEICLRTGDSGGDATALYRDPNLLGEVYVGPYVRLAPTLAFVAEDDGEVAGYVLGAADTRAFELACEREWWPALRSRYALGVFPANSPDDRLARLIHGPGETSEDVIERYPAHLHIDLLPRLQGRGFGRRLLEALFDALRTGRVPAVHLGVGLANERAIGFYERMGFTVVHRYASSQIMARPL
jgi:ribosomal protein S18 acetylase RimI-like enzyme